MRRLLTFALLTALAADVLAGESTGTGHARKAGTISLGDSPHGKADACAACHLPATDGAAAGPALPVVPTCLSCHPNADMHPVNVEQTDDIRVPENWPLENGRMVCSTCHAEPAHGAPFAQLKAPYHRGGPYEDVKDLCYRCHQRTTYVRKDPHHPNQARNIDSPTCAACHTRTPADGAIPTQANLRYALQETCTTCHQGAVHTGLDAHLGKVVPPERASKLPASITLTEDGRVACWTCHEVHDGSDATQRPVSPFIAGLRARNADEDWSGHVTPAIEWPGESTKPEHPPLLALPVADGSLCRACHGNGGP